MKLVKQAKKYVKKHEGELQERLAQSKNTKDIWARFDMVMVKVRISLFTFSPTFFCVSKELAVLSPGTGEHDDSAHPVGVTHKGN